MVRIGVCVKRSFRVWKAFRAFATHLNFLSFFVRFISALAIVK